MLSYLPKLIFFALLIKPLVFLIMGLHIHQRQRLPRHGPAILAANHNSHLDTMVLMSLFPLRELIHVRPVAAADYFLRNRFMAWFSTRVIGIIPLRRDGRSKREELFAGCHQALADGEILILFPEGSRGEPEQMSRLKKGIYYLAAEHERCQVVPIFMHGLGKSLPRGEALLVPFVCELAIGEGIRGCTSAEQMLAQLALAYTELQQQCHPPLDDDGDWN